MQHQVEYSDSIYGMKRWVFGATVGVEVRSCLGHRVVWYACQKGVDTQTGKQTVPLNRNTTSTSKATVRNRAKESGASVRNRARTAITTGLLQTPPSIPRSPPFQPACALLKAPCPRACAEQDAVALPRPQGPQAESPATRPLGGQAQRVAMGSSRGRWPKSSPALNQSGAPGLAWHAVRGGLPSGPSIGLAGILQTLLLPPECRADIKRSDRPVLTLCLPNPSALPCPHGRHTVGS